MAIKNQKNDRRVLGPSLDYPDRVCVRGVYKGPQATFIDSHTALKIPDHFYPDEPTQRLLVDIVRAGYQLSCETISHPQFWQPSWEICPICGSRPDHDEGVWVHLGEQ